MRALLPIRRDEAAAVVLSFAYFFCLLCSFYMLRPVREEMGIQGGVRNLQWLFTGTFVAMLAAVPLFGRLSSRWPRRKLLPAVYLFFSANLIVFFLLMKAAVDPATVARVFFVWLSVFNLFVVSVFWSLMADIFSNEQARRLFGLIAAGGSAGAIVGPAVTALMVTVVGIPNLLLGSAVLLSLAVVFILALTRWVQRYGRGGEASQGPPLGGSIWAGVGLTLWSRYLAGIGLLILLLAVLNTFVYFEQARLVQAAFASPEARTQLFAKMDLAVNVLTLFTQAVLTNLLISRFGVGGLLSGLLLLNVGGFFALGAAPVLTTLVVFQVLRRASDYAIIRPVREVLFTVVSREEKYKAKNFIDTVVFRGGDAATGWVVSAIQALGATTGQVALLATPLAGLAAGIAWLLGQKQEALRRPAPVPQAVGVERGAAD